MRLVSPKIEVYPMLDCSEAQFGYLPRRAPSNVGASYPGGLTNIWFMPNHPASHHNIGGSTYWEHPLRSKQVSSWKHFLALGALLIWRVGSNTTLEGARTGNTFLFLVEFSIAIGPRIRRAGPRIHGTDGINVTSKINNHMSNITITKWLFVKKLSSGLDRLFIFGGLFNTLNSRIKGTDGTNENPK